MTKMHTENEWKKKSRKKNKLRSWHSIKLDESKRERVRRGKIKWILINDDDQINYSSRKKTDAEFVCCVATVYDLLFVSLY